VKKIILHSNYSVLNKNGNMLNNVGDVSIKDFLYQMSKLKEAGLNSNIYFYTSDEIDIKDSTAVIFIDMPNEKDSFFLKAQKSNKKLYLMTWESGIINSRNFDVNLHNIFKKVFTYDDNLIDNKKYIKLAYSFNFPNSIGKRYSDKKLCCLIVGNKSLDHPLELYSHRLKLIDWFEKNHLEDFDLYGQGWNKIIPPRNIMHRAINKYNFLNQFLKPKRLSYKGAVDSKLETYSKYKFAICYENAKDLTGYISEKIFDCLFSGCVPIYWGADNINDFIPSSCFIDKRDFESFDSLHEFISNISEKEYFQYLDSIEKFIQENKNGIFSVDYFTKTIIENL
jgi:alpha(1,3/1,4) fucosyltransferase